MSLYEYKIESNDGHTQFESLTLAEEEVKEVMRYLHNANLLKCADREIILQEELRFIVKNDEVTSVPHWLASVLVFDIREQEEKRILFRLAAKN